MYIYEVFPVKKELFIYKTMLLNLQSLYSRVKNFFRFSISDSRDLDVN